MLFIGHMLVSVLRFSHASNHSVKCLGLRWVKCESSQIKLYQGVYKLIPSCFLHHASQFSVLDFKFPTKHFFCPPGSHLTVFQRRTATQHRGTRSSPQHGTRTPNTHRTITLFGVTKVPLGRCTTLWTLNSQSSYQKWVTIFSSLPVNGCWC